MHTKLKVCVGSVFSLSLLLTLLRTLCLLFCFDTSVGYFDESLSVFLLYALTAISVLFCFSPLVWFPKDSLPTAEETPPVGLAIAASALFGVSGLLLLIVRPVSMLWIRFVCGAFFLIGAPYPFLRLSRPCRKTASVLSGLFLVLGSLLVLIFSHFDMYVAANSPLKSALFAGVLSASLFLLADIRPLFGDGMPRLRLTCQMLTCIICLPTAVSGTVFYLAGNVPPLQKEALSPLWLVPFFAVTLLAGICLFTVIQPAKSPLSHKAEKRK